jgi:integral membrane sensor domain MASE1
MSTSTPNRFDIGALALIALAGSLYCITHIANSWLFHKWDISDHVGFIYLPSFLRLANVLILGLAWGTLGTAVGGFLLFFWTQESLWLSICNTTVSAGSAALAVVLMRFMQKRTLALTRLSDLLQLALLYALLNALSHHLMWSVVDPAQLIDPNQLAYMVIGDLNGAIIGALLLRWLARNTQVVQFLRQKAVEPPPLPPED